MVFGAVPLLFLPRHVGRKLWRELREGRHEVDAQVGGREIVVKQLVDEAHVQRVVKEFFYVRVPRIEGGREGRRGNQGERGRGRGRG